MAGGAGGGMGGQMMPPGGGPMMPGAGGMQPQQMPMRPPGAMGAQDMARTAAPGAMRPQPMPGAMGAQQMPMQGQMMPPGGGMPPQMPPGVPGAMGAQNMQRTAMGEDQAAGGMTPQQMAGMRLGGGLLGRMQQQPNAKLGGLLGQAMLDPTMMQALMQMRQGWGRAPQLQGMPNMNAMGPGGTLGGGV